MSFKSLCEQHNINYANAYHYKRVHPELTDEQIIEYYLDKEKGNIQSLEKLCIKYNVKYNTIYRYKRNHPELLTYEQAIQSYLTPKKSQFQILCEKNNINYTTANQYKRVHPELTDEQIIKFYKTLSLKQLCKQYGAAYESARAHRRKHPELSDEEVAKYCATHKQVQRNFSNIFKDNNIAYKRVWKYKNKHPELTDEEILEYFLKKDKEQSTTIKKSLEQLCNEYNVDYEEAISYKNECKNKYNKIRSNMEIIKHLLACKNHRTHSYKSGDISLLKLCKIYGINYEKAKSYRQYHQNITNLQVIQYYIPNSYINTQGELIVI